MEVINNITIARTRHAEKLIYIVIETSLDR